MESPSGYLYLNSNAAAHTDAKGVWLYAIHVNKAGATGNILTLTDTTTGVVYGVIDTTAIRSLNYFGLRIPGGLTATLSTGTAADVTIVYG